MHLQCLPGYCLSMSKKNIRSLHFLIKSSRLFLFSSRFYLNPSKPCYQTGDSNYTVHFLRFFSVYLEKAIVNGGDQGAISSATDVCIGLFSFFYDFFLIFSTMKGGVIVFFFLAFLPSHLLILVLFFPFFLMIYSMFFLSFFPSYLF